MALKETRLRVLEAVREELADVGFRKRAADIFTRDLSREVLGWVGLNRATRRRIGGLEINPVAGVRHQPTEELLAELRKNKAHPYVPPSLSVHLGYLMPKREYNPWLFKENKDSRPQSRRLVQAITEYGVPFMEENSALEQLVSTIEASGYGIPEQNQFRIPVMYLLLDQRKTAQENIEKRLSDLGQRDDLAARHYRFFAEALGRRLKR